MIDRKKLISILKKILIFIIILSILILFIICYNGGIQFSFGENKYFVGFGYIESNIVYKGYGCDDKEYPLSVTFDNHTSREIGNISFKIIAKFPGRTTDLVGLYNGFRSSDRIILRHGVGGICTRVPKLNTDENPEGLIWSMKIDHVDLN